MPEPLTTPVRQLVLVLRDLVRATVYDSYADLAADLKDRAAKLHIPYDAGMVSAAIDRFELGGRAPIVPSKSRRVLVEKPPENVGLSRADAARILAAINARIPVPVKTIATAVWTDREAVEREEDAARQRAAEMGITL